MQIFMYTIDRITKLWRLSFNKTLVLVKYRVYKHRPGLNIIEHLFPNAGLIY